MRIKKNYNLLQYFGIIIFYLLFKEDIMVATIKDVASMSNTSIATVSRYINGKPIKDENRESIKKAIKELKYEINSNARGLKTNSSMNIGVVVPHLNHIYDITIVKGIQNYLIKYGYNIVLLESNGLIDGEKECFEFLLRRNVDGIIVNSDSSDTSLYSQFNNSGTPIVLIDQKIDGINASAVLTDNINAIYDAVEYLIKMGHKKISIILGIEGSFTAKERLKGYLRAMEDYSMEINSNFIRYGNYRADGGYRCMGELIQCEEKPTAVIVTNYDMTHGAVLALNEKNISVPEDISFIGYDDYSLTQIYKPKLTIIMQPMIEMGEKAASLILKILKNKTEYENQVYRFKTTFIVNESVKRI